MFSHFIVYMSTLFTEAEYKENSQRIFRVASRFPHLPILKLSSSVFQYLWIQYDISEMKMSNNFQFQIAGRIWKFYELNWNWFSHFSTILSSNLCANFNIPENWKNEKSFESPKLFQNVILDVGSRPYPTHISCIGIIPWVNLEFPLGYIVDKRLYLFFSWEFTWKLFDWIKIILRSSSSIWYPDTSMENHDLWQFYRCIAAVNIEQVKIRGSISVVNCKLSTFESSFISFIPLKVEKFTKSHCQRDILYFYDNELEMLRRESSLKCHKIPLCDHKCLQNLIRM